MASFCLSSHETFPVKSLLLMLNIYICELGASMVSWADVWDARLDAERHLRGQS